MSTIDDIIKRLKIEPIVMYVGETRVNLYLDSDVERIVAECQADLSERDCAARLQAEKYVADTDKYRNDLSECQAQLSACQKDADLYKLLKTKPHLTMGLAVIEPDLWDKKLAAIKESKND